MDFFRRRSLNIHINALHQDLTYILEELSEYPALIFPGKRECWINSLNRLESQNISEQYSQDSELCDKPICSTPVSSCHSITHSSAILICGDNDETGRNTAQEAAPAAHALFFLPPLTKEGARTSTAFTKAWDCRKSVPGWKHRNRSITACGLCRCTWASRVPAQT